jgi:hypothetical protein
MNIDAYNNKIAVHKESVKELEDLRDSLQNNEFESMEDFMIKFKEVADQEKAAREDILSALDELQKDILE